MLLPKLNPDTVRWLGLFYCSCALCPLPISWPTRKFRKVLKSAQRAAEKTRWWLWNSRAGKCCREKLLKMQSLAEFIKRPSQRKCKIAFDKKARTKPTTAASGESGIRGFGGLRIQGMRCAHSCCWVANIANCINEVFLVWGSPALLLLSPTLPSHTIWISDYLISLVSQLGPRRRSKNFPYSLSSAQAHTGTHCVYVMAAGALNSSAVQVQSVGAGLEGIIPVPSANKSVINLM